MTADLQWYVWLGIALGAWLAISFSIFFVLVAAYYIDITIKKLRRRKGVVNASSKYQAGQR